MYKNNPPSTAEQYFIDLIKKRTGETLSQEDAKDAVSNICGFFKILQKWDYKDKLRQNQEQVLEQ